MYFYNFWDYWQLYHKVTFDGVNKLIYVNDGVTNLSVKIDVYSDWKEWVTLNDNAKFLPALRTIGGDPTTSGQRAGDIYFTINGWRLVVDLTKTRIDGALFSDDFPTAMLDKQTMQPVYPTLVSSLVTTPPPADLTGLNVPSAIQNAQAVWNAMLADFLLTNSFGKQLQDVPSLTAALVPTAPTAAQVASAVLDEPIIAHTTSGSTGLVLNQIKADTSSIVIADTVMTTLLNLLLQYEKGRTKIDTTNATLTVYATDGVTPIQVFNLLDFNGMPSVQEVCERVPTI